MAKCPRCGAGFVTFDVVAEAYRRMNYGWQPEYEIFCICRHCKAGTIFCVSIREIEFAKRPKNGGSLFQQNLSLNDHVNIKGFVSVKDEVSEPPPEHLPSEIGSAFAEGAACLSIGCFNAAGTMFRLCVDLATRPLVPAVEDNSKAQPNEKQRRDLGLRVPWLFDSGLLPEPLRDLAQCIREDGNDGAHAGILKKADAEDLLDFTRALLERLITEPKQLEIANERRKARRKSAY